MKKKRYSFNVKNFRSRKKEPLKPLFKKQIMVTAISVFLVVLITLAGSFAIFTKTSEGNEYNVVQVGELQLSYVDLNEEGNVLQLADSYPISDTTGEASSPYRFSVENTGTIIANYTVKIIDDTDTITADGCSDNLLDSSYLRYKFDNGTIQNLSDKKNSEDNSYVIHSGTLRPGESNIHEIRIWINQSSPNSILGTHYHGKVVIDVEQNNATDPYTRPDKLLSSYFSTRVDTSTTIDFSQISSETNGRGVYKYTEDGKSIYYTRGKVTDNHVKFAGLCWEMVRTTKNGGVKMIYDGEPDANGHCSNTGEASQLPEKSAFNSDYDIGYMYGITATADGARCITKTSNTDDTAIDSTSSYSTEEACTTAGGKWTTTAYEATHANVTSSMVKKTIDAWYKSKMLGYTDKLEDAVYCNDRRIPSGTGTGSSTTYYGAYGRLVTDKAPSLECSQLNDRFTVKEENGNGDLKYSAGLLTADEIALAGGTGAINNDYYLYTEQLYWSISPGKNFEMFHVYSDGLLNRYYPYASMGVRPVITLATGARISNGDGTETNPFVVE